MKLTNANLHAFANALGLLSPAMFNAQSQAEKSAIAPRVKGNLSYPILAYRVGRAKVAIGPAIVALQEAQAMQLAATRVRPPHEGAEVPPEDQWPSDAKRFQEAMKSILAEEIDLGDLKPLTWEILQKAGIVGGTPAAENEIEFDGSFVAALGDFLAGEPPDDVTT